MLEGTQIILFLPTPESPGSPMFCAKLGVLMASQRHFQQKIFKYIYYSCPHLKTQIPQCSVQNSVFWCLPKGISNRRYSNHCLSPSFPRDLEVRARSENVFDDWMYVFPSVVSMFRDPYHLSFEDCVFVPPFVPNLWRPETKPKINYLLFENCFSCVWDLSNSWGYKPISSV